MTTNNVAVYEVLIAGLRLAKSLMVQNLTIHNDSQMVVKQIFDEYEAKETHLRQYLQLVLPLPAPFRSYTIVGIIRT